MTTIWITYIFRKVIKFVFFLKDNNLHDLAILYNELSEHIWYQYWPVSCNCWAKSSASGSSSLWDSELCLVSCSSQLLHSEPLLLCLLLLSRSFFSSLFLFLFLLLFSACFMLVTVAFVLNVVLSMWLLNVTDRLPVLPSLSLGLQAVGLSLM